MSLTVTQRPQQTINSEISRWNAVANPVIYKMQRKDFAFDQVNDSGGFIQLQFNGTDLSASFEVGDIVYMQSDNGVYDLPSVVTASSFSTNTLVTLEDAYVSAAPGGFTNNITLYASYKVSVEIYNIDDELITESTLSYSANPEGVIVFDVSNVLRSQMVADNDADLTGTDESFDDSNVYTGFYIKYTETWIGSSEDQFDDSDNEFFTVLGAMQIPSLYGGNIYEYLISRSMKKIERTISSAEILTMFDSPIELVPAQGAGTIIVPVAIMLKLPYNSSAYATNTDMSIEINSWPVCVTLTSILTATADLWRLIVNSSSGNSSTNPENSALKIRVTGGNPTAGNSPLKIAVIYTVVTL